VATTVKPGTAPVSGLTLTKNSAGQITSSGPTLAQQNLEASETASYANTQEIAYLLANPSQIQSVVPGPPLAFLGQVPVLGQFTNALDTAGGAIQNAEFGSGGTAAQQLAGAATNAGVGTNVIQGAIGSTNVTQVGAGTNNQALAKTVAAAANTQMPGSGNALVPPPAPSSSPLPVALLVGVALAAGLGLWWALS
jgi:hypothetical protein